MAKKITHLRSRWLTEIFRLTEVVICINEKSDSYFVNVKKREKKYKWPYVNFHILIYQQRSIKTVSPHVLQKLKVQRFFSGFQIVCCGKIFAAVKMYFGLSFRSAVNHFLPLGLEFASSKNYGKC